MQVIIFLIQFGNFCDWFSHFAVVVVQLIALCNPSSVKHECNIGHLIFLKYTYIGSGVSSSPSPSLPDGLLSLTSGGVLKLSCGHLLIIKLCCGIIFFSILNVLLFYVCEV